MEHTLINTIIASIVTAFVLGLIAKKLKLPAIFGYLIAGVIIGPYTPGYVADINIAQQLAEIGIILLMFGVGLHFSFKDLMNVRKIALPGALAQMFIATFVGAVAAQWMGYQLIESIIYGFALSVASTIVLLRTLEQRNSLESQGGKIAVGWLVIEDIAMVLALVMLPVVDEISRGDAPFNLSVVVITTLSVLFKIGGFFAFMLIVGRRFLPWLLVSISKVRSSELMTLGTLAIALGFASIAYLVFDASLALGAFLAGMVLGESEIGRKAAKNSLPMRDAFSVLFFVSVGMLFDPNTLVQQPVAVLITVLIIVVANGISALAICHCFKLDAPARYTVAVGLAQIGEFSFILGSVAMMHEMLSLPLYSLILAGAMLSIVINPFLFRFSDLMVGKEKKKAA